MQGIHDYTGRLFIELVTEDAIRDVSLVTKLNQNSSRVINEVQGYTCWEMSDQSAALKAVLLIQERRYPFKLMGEDNISFIEVFKE